MIKDKDTKRSEFAEKLLQRVYVPQKKMFFQLNPLLETAGPL